MIFGSQTDFNLYKKVMRELVKDVVEQEVLYYKFGLGETETNIYGEALDKIFYTPVRLNALLTRGDQVITDDEFGPDLNRELSFAFIRADLVDINVVPEVGDVILWHEDYYEVDTVRENQLFLGKDNAYNFTNYGAAYGSSISIICDAHLTRADKLGIAQVR